MRSPARLALVLVAATTLAVSACTTTAPAPTAADASATAPLKVGLVLGGLAQDGGFNQWAYDAAKALEAQGRITVQVRESVANHSDSEAIFRQYAAEGYDLLIGWGLGFSESVFRVAEELPGTDFVATGAADVLDRTADNVETWTYDFVQFGYLTGWVAGHAQLSPWGIVDAQLAPFNEPSYEAARIAIQETNPGAVEIPPVWTGSISDAQAANQATRAQVDLGARLVVTAAYESNTGIISAAKDAGIAVIGASNSVSADATEVNLGLVQIDWLPTLEQIVTRLEEDTFGGAGYSSEIANGGIVFGEFHEVAAAPDFPADIEQRVADLAARLASGEAQLPEIPAPGDR